MKDKTLHIKYKSFDSIKELEKKYLFLYERANHALEKAYAPYSKFSVGAALMLEDQTIVEGNNQENAAYPSGLCAERVALFFAGANYPDKKIETILVVVKNNAGGKDPGIARPCGACRQVMLESEFRQKSLIEIVLVSGEGKGMIFQGVSSILPFSFDGSNLL